MLRIGLVISIAAHLSVLAVAWYHQDSKTPLPTAEFEVQILGANKADALPPKTAIKNTAPRSKNIATHDRPPAHPQDTAITNQAEQKHGVPGDSRRGRPALNYASELQSFIAQHATYPTRAKVLGQTGTVIIRLIVEKNGRFSKVDIQESSRHKILDDAAKQLVVRIGSYKPLPAGLSDAELFLLPINYRKR